MVMANIGRIPDDDSLARDIAGTMATRFASVFLWQQSGYNDMVIGFRHRLSRAALGDRLLRAPYPLEPAAALARHLRPIGPSSSPLTDDKAPIEWMTDNMIIQYVSAH
jgi:hypothetical protein